MQVNERIKKAADACQRPLAAIRLVAVSKTMPAAVVFYLSKRNIKIIS